MIVLTLRRLHLWSDTPWGTNPWDGNRYHLETASRRIRSSSRGVRPSRTCRKARSRPSSRKDRRHGENLIAWTTRCGGIRTAPAKGNSRARAFSSGLSVFVRRGVPERIRSDSYLRLPGKARQEVACARRRDDALHGARVALGRRPRRPVFLRSGPRPPLPWCRSWATWSSLRPTNCLASCCPLRRADWRPRHGGVHPWECLSVIGTGRLGRYPSPNGARTVRPPSPFLSMDCVP